MLPHKMPRGAAALGKLKVFEGVPFPYDQKKRMVMPDALRTLRLQARRPYCSLGELAALTGWTKADVKQYLYDHARLPAWEFERQLRVWNIRGVWDLKDDVRNDRIPKVFYESEDENRLLHTVRGMGYVLREPE